MYLKQQKMLMKLLLQVIYLFCNPAMFCVFIQSNSNPINLFSGSVFVMTTIFNGICLIIIWTQAQLLLGDNLNTDPGFRVMVVVCVSACVCFCHLVIPIHSAWFSFTHSSLSKRPCCFHVGLTCKGSGKYPAVQFRPVLSRPDRMESWRASTSWRAVKYGHT